MSNTHMTGEYTHQLDPKRRLSIPAKFRRTLGDQVVVVKWLDNALRVYTKAEFNILKEKLVTLSLTNVPARKFLLFVCSGAESVDIDGAGRVLVTEDHARYADLKERVVIVGMLKHIEIWNESKWRKTIKEIEENISDYTTLVEI